MDADGKTVDEELEKANFASAGQTLSEVWSGMVIDNHPVISEYIEPDKSEMNRDDLRTVSVQWRTKHVRESQYCTQVMKCEDSGCCRPPRSSIFMLLSSRFLPPPIPLMQMPEGLKAPEPRNQTGSKFLALILKPDVFPRCLTG